MIRAAVATTDRITVNEHFGRAKFFHIFEADERGVRYVEARDAVAACQQSFGHSVTRFDRIAGLMSDCDLLLVQKIGEGAAEYMILKGVRVFQCSGSIEAVLKRLISDGIIEDRG